MLSEGSATLGIKIGFSAKLRSSLGDQGIAEVLSEVKSFVQGAAIELHFPLLQIEVLDTNKSNDELDVVINSMRCRVPFENIYSNTLETTSSTLAARVARIIHANREFLVDASIAEVIRAEQYSAQSGLYLPGLSRRAFQQYIRLLIRGCFHLGKRDIFIDTKSPPLRDWTAEACYEQATGSISDLRFVLWQPSTTTGTAKIEGHPIEQLFERKQEDLFYELGIRFPHLKLDVDETLGKSEFRIQINDLRLPTSIGLEDGEFLVSSTPEHLKTLSIKGKVRTASNPETGAMASIVGDAKLANKAREAGLMTWGQAEYKILACIYELRKHVATYITTESIDYELDKIRPWYGDVVAAAEKLFGVSKVAQVLRSLAEEGISIRNLVGVLEAMLAVNFKVDIDFDNYFVFPPFATGWFPAMFGTSIEEIQPEGYAECVRNQFREYISYKYALGQNTLSVYTLDKSIESRVARSETSPLRDKEKLDILKTVEEQIVSLNSWDQNPIILTSLKVRKHFRRIIEVEFPYIAVLSYQELSPNFKVRLLDKITVNI